MHEYPGRHDLADNFLILLLGLDGLRTTASIIHLDIYILIQESTAPAIIMTAETLQNMRDEGAGPTFSQCLVLEGAVLYRLHYARRSVSYLG